MSKILPLAHISVTFVFDGEKYSVDQFDMEFSQSIDYKGQPQHETKGEQIMLHLTQKADANLYLWAKKSTLRKDGTILFQTDLGMTVLEITFKNAYCVNLTREINISGGTNTSLTIAPEIIDMNGIEHNKFWAK
ncbi:MAG: hypothetical protein LBL07_04795 [Tannerella sp.]|jgi:hypothetical protein|nr:hypothetical protein [Tannerella sp.]